MTITFNPILLENPKFRELITNKEMLSIYRPLHDATVENINFLKPDYKGKAPVRIIYSFLHYEEATHAKQAINQNPPYQDIHSVQQERNLVIITYNDINL